MSTLKLRSLAEATLSVDGLDPGTYDLAEAVLALVVALDRAEAVRDRLLAMTGPLCDDCLDVARSYFKGER